MINYGIHGGIAKRVLEEILKESERMKESRVECFEKNINLSEVWHFRRNHWKNSGRSVQEISNGIPEKNLKFWDEVPNPSRTFLQKKVLKTNLGENSRRKFWMDLFRPYETILEDNGRGIPESVEEYWTNLWRVFWRNFWNKF